MTQSQNAGESLGREFFERPPDAVAHDLIGCYLVVHDGERVVRARLVETEAYGGHDDPASHAFRGPTPRSTIMFGPAGFLYVYRSYGIHWCMNVVTEYEGAASAVLLRGADVVDHAGAQGPPDAPRRLLRGPGNLTRGLGITGADNGVDCCQGPSGRVAFEGPGAGEERGRVGCSRRIGVSRGIERTSRYFLEGHPAVSAHPRATPGRSEPA